jgi:lipopolysaccharide transport protein LptA
MIAAVIFALLLVSVPIEPSAPTPAEDWTVVTCDGNLTVDYELNQATFFRNVLIKNPRGTLNSEKLIIYFTEQGKAVEKAEALGGVAVDMGERTGRADAVVYFPQEKKVVMSGGATIKQAEGIVRGETITFFLDRREMQVEGSPGADVIPEKDVDVGF